MPFSVDLWVAISVSKLLHSINGQKYSNSRRHIEILAWPIGFAFLNELNTVRCLTCGAVRAYHMYEKASHAGYRKSFKCLLFRHWAWIIIITGRIRRMGKVLFSQVSVHTWGVPPPSQSSVFWLCRTRSHLFNLGPDTHLLLTFRVSFHFYCWNLANWANL